MPIIEYNWKYLFILNILFPNSLSIKGVLK